MAINRLKTGICWYGDPRLRIQKMTKLQYEIFGILESLYKDALQKLDLRNKIKQNQQQNQQQKY